MKLNRTTYFSFFFLFCFIASFSANVYQAIQTQAYKTKVNISHSDSFIKRERNSDTKVDLLLEKNETETENNFELQAFVLPFFISYYQFHSLIEKPLSIKPLAEKLTNPIYIAVCNFRI